MDNSRLRRSNLMGVGAIAATIMIPAQWSYADASVTGESRSVVTTSRVLNGELVVAEDRETAIIPLPVGKLGVGGVGYASANAAPASMPNVAASCWADQASAWREGNQQGFPNLLFLDGRARASSQAVGDGALTTETSASSVFEVSFEVDTPSLFHFRTVVRGSSDLLSIVPPGEASVTLTGPGGTLLIDEHVGNSGSLTRTDTLTIPAGAYTLTVSAQRDFSAAQAGSVRGESFARCSATVNPEIFFVPTINLTPRLPQNIDGFPLAPAVLTVVSDERTAMAAADAFCPEKLVLDNQTLIAPAQPSPRAWSAEASAQARGVRPIIHTNVATQRSIASDAGLLFAEGYTGYDYTIFPPASGHCTGGGEALSNYRVVFDLTQSQPFRLHGLLATAVDAGPGVPGGWARVHLERPTPDGREWETLILHEVGLFTALTFSQSIHEAGMLEAGRYRLQLEAYRYPLASQNNGSITHGELYYAMRMSIGRLAADLTGDGAVDVDDLLAVILNWGSCSQCTPIACPADVNLDCAVDVDDLLLVIVNWG